MIFQRIQRHFRLLIAFTLGLLVCAFFPASPDYVLRFLLGWNVAVWSYIILMFWLMTHATPERVEQLAEQEDEADLGIMVFMLLAATASLAAIVLELGTIEGLESSQKIGSYAITIATVLGSWFFVATLFTFHYARLYYRSPEKNRVLIFPDQNLQPNYWDFLYFSLTLAVAFQTSDIALSSRSIRKTALAQCVLSFWFNIAILGLSINIAAGIVKS